MKLFLMTLLVCLVAVAHCQEKENQEDDDDHKESWWTGFKNRIKAILAKWRDDVRLLWDDVLGKADDMRGWTREMFDSFKLKIKEWLSTSAKIPDDEKNEIETFISKLKLPAEEPSKSGEKIEP